jgi:putative ABC transport system permease protein
MFTAGLIAMAVFLLVALEAFRHAPGQVDLSKNSGTGGFPLLAESQWPIYQDLNLSDTLPKSAKFRQLRVRPGEEASCLNLYQPTRPKIAAIPGSLAAEGRFQFTGSGSWSLLEKPTKSKAIPAIVDNNTMLYVLHKQIGDVLEIPNGAEPLRLEIVAALSGSIFQSEILIAESEFLKAFPHEQGFRLFLIEAEESEQAALTAQLEDALSDSGFDVSPTAERLAQYHRVENTYLSTFQALGALGLLVGTIGLAAVLLRNVLERRRQLALLNAVGFEHRDLFALVLAENAMLLVAGLAAGTLTALLAVSPALIGRAQAAHPVGLIALVSGVWAIGLLAAACATHFALKTPLLAALRSE